MTTPRIEEIVEEHKKHFIIRDKAYDAGIRQSDWLRTALTQTQQQAYREAVEIIKEELKKAPLEVQMTKGIVFASVIKRLQYKITKQHDN